MFFTCTFSGHNVFRFFLWDKMPHHCSENISPTIICLRSAVITTVFCWRLRSNAPAMMSNKLGQLEKWRYVLFSIVYVWERGGGTLRAQRASILYSQCKFQYYVMIWIETLLLFRIKWSLTAGQNIAFYSGPNSHLQKKVAGGGRRSLRRGSSILAYGEETGEVWRGGRRGGRWRCRHYCWASGAWPWATPHENQLHK